MSAKLHQMRKPEARANVRVGVFERSLNAFAEEMGQKVAITLGKYDEERIVPFAQRGMDTAVALEAMAVRVAWLETPAWKRIATRLQRWWSSRQAPWDAAGSWRPWAVIPPEREPAA